MALNNGDILTHYTFMSMFIRARFRFTHSPQELNDLILPKEMLTSLANLTMQNSCFLELEKYLGSPPPEETPSLVTSLISSSSPPTSPPSFPLSIVSLLLLLTSSKTLSPYHYTSPTFPYTRYNLRNISRTLTILKAPHSTFTGTIVKNVLEEFPTLRDYYVSFYRIQDGEGDRIVEEVSVCVCVFERIVLTQCCWTRRNSVKEKEI